jgi:putative DNA primase/helicase
MGGDKMNFDSLNNIPQELRELDRWVCWRIEERDGKPTKVPVNAGEPGQKRAMSDNPSTWSDFNTAVEKMKQEGLPGIGFIFNGDGLLGVDVDDCRNPETGIMTEVGRDIIKTLDSFTELSPSGKGVHIICRGKLPPGRKQTFIMQDGVKAHLGAYDTGRFFCMTGNVLDDVHMDVEERTAELAVVHEKYINVKKVGKNANDKAQNAIEKPVFVNASSFVSEDEVLERIMNGKEADENMRLMNGNWKGRYTSQSEADIRLLNALAYFTDKNPSLMESMFRRSGLMRPKFDEKEKGTYKGSLEIQDAIDYVPSTYSEDRAAWEATKEAKKKKVKKSQEQPHEIDQGLEQLGDTPPEQLPDWITGPYNDMWNAERLTEHCGIDIRYCRKQESWYIWNDKFWEEDKLDYIRSKADETIMNLYHYKTLMYERYGKSESKEAKQCYTEFVSWLSKSRNTGRKDNMIRETGSKRGIGILPEYFDADPWLLNCKSGTIDLKTGEIKPFERKNMITKIVPVEYVQDAKTPQWDNFLGRIFDNKKDLIEFMQRAVGYSLTGGIQEQCMFVCHGSGANGKSTFINIIQDMLGEYAKGTNFSTFAVKNDSNTNDIARLAGSRFVSAMEVGENKWLNAALIKQLTGGDKISARFLHKEFFEFVPTFKIWMGVNHKPGINETDYGTWRRIKLIPFEVTIPDSEKDEELPNKLKAELPGIFAWALKGCLMCQKEGLNPPGEISAATEAYRGEMDTIQAFIDECIQKKEGNCVRSGDLYNVFKLWCEENGIRKPITSTKFAVKMQEKHFKKDRNKVMRYWEDIQLSDYGKLLLHRKIEGKSQVDDIEYEQDSLPMPWNKL